MNNPIIQAALKAEQNVIGCIILDNSTIEIIREIVSKKDFYAEYNREIFGAICDLAEKNEPINMASLLGHLVSSTSFNANGGVSILTRATGELPSAALADSYAKNVHKYSTMRTLETLGASIKENASANVDIYEYISKVKDELESISECQQTKSWIVLGEAINNAITSIKDGNGADVVKSGFVDLDAKLTGFKAGTLTIIAARPAMGKTAFGLNIMMNAAFNSDVPTAFFSLEMTGEELALRVISCSVSISGTFLKQGKITTEEFGRILDFWETKGRSKIFIDETPGIDISILRDRVKRMYKRFGIKLLIVDYLQLMQSNKKRVQSREQEVADVSRGLKGIAKELHIPVIALSQLNRNVDTRTEKRPVLSDLRESGSIEQDADNILFIHREDYYRPNAEQNHEAEIIIAKQRSGPTGVVKLHWDGQYTRFSNLEDRF